MVKTRLRMRRIIAVKVLVLLIIVLTLSLALFTQTPFVKPSAAFSWQNKQWCPSYHNYWGCDTVQKPVQYSVSFAPSQVSASGQVISLRMNSAAKLSGAINTFGIETWNAPTIFIAKLTLPCNATGQIVNWPAFWVVSNGAGNGAQGETDILEGLGGKATWTYHYLNSSGQHADISGAPAGNWCGTHTYEANWKTSSITFTWDGKNVGRVSSSQIGVPIALGPMYAIFDYGASPVYGGPTTANVTMKLLKYSAS
jgi:Glycosyl hydrolases family 16